MSDVTQLLSAIELADPETIRDIVLRRQTEPERWERRFSYQTAIHQTAQRFAQRGGCEG
jgi:hypothetical protein